MCVKQPRKIYHTQYNISTKKSNSFYIMSCPQAHSTDSDCAANCQSFCTSLEHRRKMCKAMRRACTITGSTCIEQERSMLESIMQGYSSRTHSCDGYYTYTSPYSKCWKGCGTYIKMSKMKEVSDYWSEANQKRLDKSDEEMAEIFGNVFRSQDEEYINRHLNFTLEKTEEEQKRDNPVVTIGQGDGLTEKTVTVDDYLECPDEVNRSNWLGGYGSRDRFEIKVNGKDVTAKRIDAEVSWGMNLQFACQKTDAPKDDEVSDDEVDEAAVEDGAGADGGGADGGGADGDGADGADGDGADGDGADGGAKEEEGPPMKTIGVILFVAGIVYYMKNRAGGKAGANTQ